MDVLLMTRQNSTGMKQLALDMVVNVVGDKIISTYPLIATGITLWLAERREDEGIKKEGECV